MAAAQDERAEDRAAREQRQNDPRAKASLVERLLKREVYFCAQVGDQVGTAGLHVFGGGGVREGHHVYLPPRPPNSGGNWRPCHPKTGGREGQEG